MASLRAARRGSIRRRGSDRRADRSVSWAGLPRYPALSYRSQKLCCRLDALSTQFRPVLRAIISPPVKVPIRNEDGSLQTVVIQCVGGVATEDAVRYGSPSIAVPRTQCRGRKSPQLLTAATVCAARAHNIASHASGRVDAAFTGPGI